MVALPGSEATIRGYSAAALIIEDEAARVPDNLYRAVRPMLAVTDGRLILMSTPYGKRGHFYEEWEFGKKLWEQVRITADNCPRITPAFLAGERASLGDLWFRQEYFGEFLAAGDSIFDYDTVTACVTDKFAPLDMVI